MLTLLTLALLAPELGPHVVLDPVGGQPAVSPDGRLVVYRKGLEGEGDLFIKPLEGGEARPLITHPGEDAHPTFNRDGTQVIWASNRKGSFDLFVAPVAGGAPRRLTDHPGDELHPAVSPLLYRFSAVIDEACGGPMGREIGVYEKVAYTRREGEAESVWFTSLDSVHAGRLSPKGQRCRRPFYSSDGLSVSWSCGDAARDARAEWHQSFGAALGTLEEGFEGCEVKRGEDLSKAWDKHACLKKLPRHYATHAPLKTPGAGALSRGYSHNQILLLGQRGGEIVSRLRAEGGAWAKLAAGRAPRWSPTGRHLIFEGEAGLVMAPTQAYLQRVRNLYDYPELWREGPSQRLAEHRFVARPSLEKELFAYYEKVRYARRGPFVTADAALQIFHDELASLLKASEREAMATLMTFSQGQRDRHLARAGAHPTAQYLAALYATAALLLEAADGYEVPEVAPGEEAAKPDPMKFIAGAVKPKLEALPPEIKPQVEARVKAILAHAGISKLQVPGIGEVLVDDSQFQVRGHYRGSELAGYFLAMQHFAQMPIPLNAEGLRALHLDRKSYAQWEAVEALGAAFLGRPIDPTPAHIRQLIEAQPALFQPGQGCRLNKALIEAVGPIPMRGLSGAAGGPRVVHVKLFPKRFGLDSGFFSKLTSPTLQVPELCPRAFPMPEEVFAVMGVPRAQALVSAAVGAAIAGKGCDELAWLKTYKEALDGLIEAHGEGIAQADLYHGVLALLRTLALRGGEGHRFEFTRSTAWADRTLLSALAGYTQLKHDAVLYAAQEYGVECDGGAPIKLFIEQPILPTPQGFVDPMPTFFRQMEALAGVVYARLAKGKAPAIREGWEASPGASAMNAKRFAGRLAAIAEREIAGGTVSEEDNEWLFLVGGLMEAFLIGQKKTPDTFFGADEGRMERGVTLVTDIYTYLTTSEVLQLGLGYLLHLFVIVPEGPSEALTQGAIQSYRAFKHPMRDRLTDEAFWDKVKAGEAPPMPAWTASFIEEAP